SPATCGGSVAPSSTCTIGRLRRLVTATVALMCTSARTGLGTLKRPVMVNRIGSGAGDFVTGRSYLRGASVGARCAAYCVTACDGHCRLTVYFCPYGLRSAQAACNGQLDRVWSC